MLVLFQDPVIASDGFIYERQAVETLIRSNRPSPMTREAFSKSVFKARQKAQDAKAYREKMVKELIKFALLLDEVFVQMSMYSVFDCSLYLDWKRSLD